MYRILVLLFWLGFLTQGPFAHAGSYEEDCENDLKYFCPGLSFNDTVSTYGCLIEHEDQLSVNCKVHIEQSKAIPPVPPPATE